MNQTKVCKECGIEKELNDFHKRSDTKDKKQPKCKVCNNKLTSEASSERYKKNPLYREINKIRSLIRKSVKYKIKNNCVSKPNSKLTKLLGCSIEDFIKHIEDQFEDWMSWENYGGKSNGSDYNISWEFDHIDKLKTANTIEEIHKLNHYKNIRPVCSRINRLDR